MSTDHARPDLAVFIPSYWGGGGEQVAMFIATSLAAEGLRVDLVVARTAGELRNAAVPGVRRVELGAMNEMLAAVPWIRYLRTTRPRCAMSLIHSANFNSGLGALFVPSVPVIVNLRFALDCHPSAQWWLRSRFGLSPERWLYRNAARVVGVSDGVSAEAARLLGLPRHQVLTVPNPVRSQGTTASIPGAHAHLFERPVILGAGRLAPQKNFALLLDAFARIARSTDANLVVLGEGPQRRSLARQAARLDLADRVFFPGFVSDPAPYMRRARLFALSSRNEGFPSVLLEAMAAGSAVVSTDCAFGPSEILDNGRFGALVEVDDIDGFARALGTELARPDIGHEARRKERARWMRQYDAGLITRQYLRLVQDVILEFENAAPPRGVTAPREHYVNGWRGVDRRQGP